jgi:Pregnancy-associated plasma protein-A
MKQFFYFIAMACLVLDSSGQIKNCGFKLNEEQKRIFLSQIITNRSDSLEFAERAVIEIPVVFHIIFNNAREKIDDAKIIKELEELNRDFQLLNTDTSRLPEQFKLITGNPRIKFKLAMIDPEGNHTTGIIRKPATRNVYTFSKPIFFADKIWDSKRFLNIYIGNIKNGSTRGYVNSFPWRNPQTDAIGLYYEDIGMSTRLLTHEAGHWFGLWHIVEGACSDANDGIDDTPKQHSFTRGCPSTKSECSNNCLFMNYMDYSSCRVMFTIGQAQRMNEVIAAFRPALLSQ